MPNDSDSALFPLILSGLIVVISTVAVILGSTDGARSAPTGDSAQPAAVQPAAAKRAAGQPSRARPTAATPAAS